MAFNITKFDQAQFKDRTKTIEVPELASFFGDDEKPQIIVRGLTGHELAVVNEAVKTNKDVSSILEGIASEVNSEKVQAIKDSLGLTDNSPDDLVRRIAALQKGTVSIELSQEMCVKLAENYPTTFFLLTNKIFEATGEGKELGK